MHLMSGIVKAVVKLSFRALKANNKLGEYVRSLRDSTNINIISSLNIPWFTLTPILSENFPGMGCNSHIAIGRYLKIMGLNLKNIKEKRPTIFPPN